MQEKGLARTGQAVNVAMLLRAALWASLTGVLSLVAVPLPFSPVPLSCQTFGTMLSGLALGPWWGAASMAIYLGIGCVGFPVFAGGNSGPGTLFGPTGGYLFGFVLGAWVTGFLSGALNKHKKGQAGWLTSLIPVVVGGIGVVHATGTLYLSWYTGLALREALWAGSIPFLPLDLLKAVLTALLAQRLRSAGQIS